MLRRTRDYSLSIALGALFALSWVGQFTVQVLVVGETPSEFLAATLENWQSEFLQLLTFVVLAAVFIHRGSPQSKDGDEELRRRLDQLDRKVDLLLGSGGREAGGGDYPRGRS